MKALLIGEVLRGKLAPSLYEMLGFASQAGLESVVLVCAPISTNPQFTGKLYQGDGGEYDPLSHKAMALEVIAKENPDLVVLMHSSYGWDLAPRLAMELGWGQISEAIAFDSGTFNQVLVGGKLRRSVKTVSGQAVVTLQSGAFSEAAPAGSPALESISALKGAIEWLGYVEKPAQDLDLTKAQKIVSAGRGIGKADNLGMIQELAQVLGAELGASRPVVDSGWVEHSHQVGSTGATVTPELYMACGISGAVQHLAGMKKSELIIAINKDKDAPIGEVAHYVVVADLLQFVPALTKALKA